jgi:tetratricopeptide (TPR) repeat protein
LTEVIDALGATAARETKVRALLVRSETRLLLGENTAADADISAAREILPNEPSVLCEHARILLNRSARQHGIEELRQAVALSERRHDTVMCLAVALSAGSDPGEREEAVRLFFELAARPGQLPPGVREHAISSALLLIEDLKSLQNCDFLSEIPSSSISPTASAAFRSKLALVRGKKDEASRYADEAIASIVESTTRTDIRILATLLSDLGRQNDALKLWQRIADCKSLNIDTCNLLDCATRLARHGVTLEVCEQLRIAGVDDADLVSHEAAVRFIYEPDRAIELLQQYFRRNRRGNFLRGER